MLLDKSANENLIKTISRTVNFLNKRLINTYCRTKKPCLIL